MKILFNAIREYRKASKMRQGDLADAVGVTRQTIISWESGAVSKSGPSTLHALILSIELDTSLDNLFWLKEDEHAATVD